MEAIAGQLGGSVGWDASLVAPAGDAAALRPTDDFDANSLIERTREVQVVDANDYSRFKDIGASDSDDEADAKKKKEEAKVAPSTSTDVSACRNCRKPGAKLKCSVCKKAVYCARACQASDWPFHKRICKKPEAPKPPQPPRKTPKSAASTSAASSSSSPSSSASTTTKATNPASSSSTKSSVVVADEPDLPAAEMRGYKNGMPYFHRELSKEEKSLIGDIAPQKIAPAPVKVEAAPVHEGSAWNAAGTFEERSYTKWAEQKFGELFTGASFSDGGLRATFKAPEKISGDASICVVRGRKRFLFDFSLTVPFEVASNGGTYKGSYVLGEISNDEDYEIACKLSKKPTNSAELGALQQLVATKKSGLQAEVLRLLGEFARDFQNQ